MIACAARTGSTLLVHMLRSNPDIFCHGEVFGLDNIVGLQGCYAEAINGNKAIKEQFIKERRQNPTKFLYKYILDPQGRRTVGFKYKTDELFLDRYKSITNIISDDLDIKIIYLLRKSLLAQYFSHQVVLKQTGVTLVHKECDIPQISPMRISPNDCKKYFLDVLQRQRKAEQLFLNHRSIKVYYEDIRQGNGDAIEQLHNFLDVRNVGLSSTTKKIVKKPLNEMIENYDEIVAFLNENGLASHV